MHLLPIVDRNRRKRTSKIQQHFYYNHISYGVVVPKKQSGIVDQNSEMVGINTTIDDNLYHYLCTKSSISIRRQSSPSHSRPIEQLLVVNNTFNRISYTTLHPKLPYQWISLNYAPSRQHPISCPLLMVNYCNFHPPLYDIEDRKISHKTNRILDPVHRKTFLKPM